MYQKKWYICSVKNSSLMDAYRKRCFECAYFDFNPTYRKWICNLTKKRTRVNGICSRWKL